MLCTLLIAGLIGSLGATIFFPILAARRGREVVLSPSNRQIVRSLSVLIPAHNESGVIGMTVRSVVASKQELSYSAIASGIEVSVVVAADACTDATVEESAAAGAEVKSFFGLDGANSHSKWTTLTRLIAESSSDVVVLADSGIAWPSSLLAQVVHEFEDEQVMAVAPAYRNPGGGLFERMTWKLESFIKTLESRAGGPVSVHGATVAYRRNELLEALRRLDEQHWLNDDVVIPLALRSAFPEKRIVYASGILVSDSPACAARTKLGTEYGRRRRMMVGNVQWIKRLLPSAWQANRPAGILALRRAFRVLWCWWLALLAVPLVLLAAGSAAGGAAVLSLVAAAVVAGLVNPAVGRLLDAAAASLVAPYYLVTLHRSKEVVWE